MCTEEPAEPCAVCFGHACKMFEKLLKLYGTVNSNIQQKLQQLIINIINGLNMHFVQSNFKGQRLVSELHRKNDQQLSS